MKKKTLLGNPDNAKRAPLDFYTTPPEATRALLSVEEFSGLVWEPACGDGAISDVLEEHGKIVVSTDIANYGYHKSGSIDFLDESTWGHHGNMKGACNHVVTNPPFSLAQEFVEKALSFVDGKVAMLLRLQFLEGSKRKEFFESTPLARVWVFSGRISCHRGGDRSQKGGMMAHAWFVWDKDYTGNAPQIGWIRPLK